MEYPMKNPALYLQKKKARRLGVKINNFKNISRSSHLVMECPSSIGDTDISVINGKDTPLCIGAHTYMRGGIITHTESIGRYCSIGQDVTIGMDGKSHPIDWISTSPPLSGGYVPECTPVVIGHDVWIGHGAVIMSGVKIGHGAVIGQNALVTKDVDPYQITGGNPARPIRYRFDRELADKLIQSEWWTRETSKLCELPRDDADAFLSALESIDKIAEYPTVTIRNRRIVT